MREVTVKENDQNQSLLKFLSKMLTKMPLTAIHKAIRKGRVRINGKKTVDHRFVLSCGDVLSLYINDEFFEVEANKFDFLSVKGEVCVVYEDENILIANKPPALAVHDFEGGGTDTLINRIIRYLYDKKEYNPESENSFEPALCNRIDRNTCGMVIAAKNAQALRDVNDAIKNHRVNKKYLCLVHGAPQKKSDEVTLYLKKLSDKNMVLVSKKEKPDYKTAITKYETLETKKGYSLLEVTLKTGRTHQIRATMMHLGCSIVGDGKYGNSYAQDKQNGFPYQALCSYYLSFNFDKASFLSYLNEKEFEVSDIWFRNLFYR